MIRPRIPTLLFPLLLLAAVSLWARKQPEMPENFGTDEWAVAHYQEAVGYLKYLTDNKDRQKLLSVPEKLRLEAWGEFWNKLDPVSISPENEYRDAYFARIEHANLNYGTILLPGWLTDRGETYVRLGPPNSIERFTMRAGGKDLEVWSYWTPREVNLVFLDRTGVGDFYLLNPGDMIDQVFIYGGR